MHQRFRGFTLIELMIAVAIVAILAAIAFPSYSRHIQKSRREAVKAELLSMAQTLERLYAVNYSYASASIGSGGLPTYFPTEAGASDAYYQFSLPEGGLDKENYQIVATPMNAQSNDSCGALSIDQAGVKSPTTDGCW